jgi:type I restriction enzyme R subunit
MSLTETDTCMRLITPALEAAGWDIQTQIRREVTFTAGRIHVRGRLTHRGTPARADYVLYRGDIALAVIEAKKQGLGPANGIQQALRYAEQLDVPFAIASDGTGFHIHDRTVSATSQATGQPAAVESTIAMNAFPSPDAMWDRYRQWKSLDSDAATAIATQPYYEDPTDRKEPRYYQRIAIQRVVESIAKGERRALLVMATGTGKTYTAFQIIHRLWKSGAVKRVLFLADRNILVDQTRVNDFKPFGEVMTKITNRQADPAYQIYLALYQAISGKDGEPDLYRQFSPDFFDLIVVDECHRGSAKETSAWREVLDYFDGAIHLGLTATPKETGDVSTTTYFGDPVYYYTLGQGIDDGFLAPYKVVRYNLDKDVQGWRPTPGMTDDLGEEIEDREYNQKDMEKTLVLNHRTKTVARLVVDYIEKIGVHSRAIVFCVDIDHASRMRTALINEVAARFPDEARRVHDYVVQITGDNPEGKARLDDFINPRKTYPVIATTSKLLTTGVDAKDCQLIVIDQEINSIGEFKQIVGRGTRVDEKHGKTWFTIMDFRGVTRHFADPDFDGLPEVVYDPKSIDDPVDPGDEGETPGGETGDGITDPTDPFDGDGGGDPDPTKRPRYVVSGVPVAVLGERVQYLGPDGRLITESLTDYAKSRITDRFRNLDSFLAAWSDAEKKQVIVTELEEQGVFFEEIRDTVEKTHPGAFDPFDLVCHVAFGQPPLTRRERAENVKKRHVFAKYGEQSRRVIEILLEKYADEGLAAVEDIGVLAAPPFDQVGMPLELVKAFGGKRGYEAAVRDLETALYATG